MAKNDAQSAVNFQSEAQDVEFQPEGELAGAEQEGGRLGGVTESLNWNKVGIGVGAAAAVAGAAFAAKRFIGRGSESDEASIGGKNKQSS